MIVETRGLVDHDVTAKIQRMAWWIANVNALQTDVIYNFVFVDQAGFSNYKPKSFGQLLQEFTPCKIVKTSSIPVIDWQYE